MRYVQDSYTIQVQLVNQSHLNGYRRLFGGQLMAWMDEVAGITARRHCRMNVTTACVERLNFRAPAYANDALVLTGHIVQVGRTSMTVKVEVFVEGMDGKRTLINEAHFVMVALDENDQPTEAPDIFLYSERELREKAVAEKLRAATR